MGSNYDTNLMANSKLNYSSHAFDQGGVGGWGLSNKSGSFVQSKQTVPIFCI